MKDRFLGRLLGKNKETRFHTFRAYFSACEDPKIPNSKMYNDWQTTDATTKDEVILLAGQQIASHLKDHDLVNTSHCNPKIVDIVGMREGSSHWEKVPG